MAFFKFRGARASKSDEPARSDERKQRKPANTVESLRRSARHRLVGAAVLVLAAVIGFPLLFETEPRPLPVNAPVTIPHRDQVPPLAMPKPQKGDVAAGGSLASNEELVPIAPPSGSAPVTAGASVPPGGVAQDGNAAKPGNGGAPAPEGKTAQAGAAPSASPAAVPADESASSTGQREAQASEDAARKASEHKAALAEQARQAQKAKEAKQAQARKADEARALAALQGKTVPDKPAASAADEKGSFVIQIGAFSDVQRATDMRQKAVALGLKSYTQALKSKDGQLTTRVRVGPFSSRAEAERAAATLKRAGLSGQILPS